MGVVIGAGAGLVVEKSTGSAKIKTGSLKLVLNKFGICALVEARRGISRVINRVINR